MVVPWRWIGIAGAVIGVQALACAESELAYEDLRVQAGLASSIGQSVAVSFMCGDIGDKDQHVVDIGSDLGIVLGLRGVASQVRATVANAADIDLNLLGGEIMGGFGYYIGRDDLLEVLGGGGRGITSASGKTALSHRNGSYRVYFGEIGYYHTFGKSRIQLGLVGGYEIDKISFRIDSGDMLQARSSGVDLAIALGYRF